MADEQAQPDVESLRITVDADGNVVPDGDPAGAKILTGQDAAKALEAQERASKAAKPEQKAQSEAESKARQAPPENKGR